MNCGGGQGPHGVLSRTSHSPLCPGAFTGEDRCPLWTVGPYHGLGKGKQPQLKSRPGLGVPLSHLLRSSEKPSRFPPRFRLWGKEKLTSAASPRAHTPGTLALGLGFARPLSSQGASGLPSCSPLNSAGAGWGDGARTELPTVGAEVAGAPLQTTSSPEGSGPGCSQPCGSLGGAHVGRMAPKHPPGPSSVRAASLPHLPAGA